MLSLIEGPEVVKIRDIISCTTHYNFTDLYFVHKPKMMRMYRTLNFYEELMAESGFLRVHNSQLINLEHVAKYHGGKGGESTMSDGSEVPLSPQKKDVFMEQFRRARCPRNASALWFEGNHGERKERREERTA